MWVWRRRREEDLARELKSDLDLEAADRESRGLSPAQARLAAHRAFGNSAWLAEETRQAWGWTWIERLFQDLRYAARMLRKSPAFTAVAVLSLALGIGANTAVFSVLDAVLLKSLPVKNPEQLRIFTWNRRGDPPWMKSHSGYSISDDHGIDVDGSFSYPAFQFFQRSLPQFSDVIAFAQNQFSVTAEGSSSLAFGHFVSGNYFAGLGAAPMLGRAILPEDDQPSSPRVAVLTYRYWDKEFGADPAIVGRVIQINRIPVTVIGVMPPAFQGLLPGRAVDLFTPFAMLRETGPAYYSLSDPTFWWVQVFGRVRAGAGDAAATAAAQTALTHQIESYFRPADVEAKPTRIVLEPGGHGAALLRGSTLIPIKVLGATALLVLLIACINLVNLLLARYSARSGELAVRISIGAGRGRLIRQMLTENLLLAVLGAGAGLLLALPLVRLLLNFLSGATPLGLDAHIDFRALAFTAAAAIATVLVFGVFPSWRATRPGAAEGLKNARPGSGGQRGGHQAGRYLVSLQIALSLPLLVGTGLFLRTLVLLTGQDLGFQPDHLLTFQTDPGRTGYEYAQAGEVYRRLEQRIAAIPGVTSVAISQDPLIGGVSSNGPVRIPGVTGGKQTYFMMCSDSFLHTAGIAILHGRDLNQSDFDRNIRSAVVNESFAAKYLPGEDPIGRIFYPPDWQKEGPDRPPFTIVGVSRDAHYRAVREVVPPTAYVPFGRRSLADSRMVFLVRTRAEPLSIAADVRRAVAAVDPHLPVADLRTQRDQIAQSIGSERMFAALVAAFGAIALILAAIGAYGVMAFSVARRIPEIGIRMALGAQRRQVLAMVLRQSLLLSVLGVVAGVPAAQWLASFVKGLLFGVKPADPLSVIGAVALMIAVAVLAAWIPARRASRVDPMRALRYE